MKVEGPTMEEPSSSNGFHSNHFPSSSSSSSSLTNSNNDLTIFPPINHEGLPIPASHAPRSHAPLSFFNSEPVSPSSSPPRQPHFSRFAYLALRFCHSKLCSLFSSFRNGRGVFSVFSPVSVVVLVGLWFWVYRVRRRRKLSGGESVEHLKRVIKDKDEPVVLLSANTSIPMSTWRLLLAGLVEKLDAILLKVSPMDFVVGLSNDFRGQIC